MCSRSVDGDGFIVPQTTHPSLHPCRKHGSCGALALVVPRELVQTGLRLQLLAKLGHARPRGVRAFFCAKNN